MSTYASVWAGSPGFLILAIRCALKRLFSFHLSGLRIMPFSVSFIYAPFSRLLQPSSLPPRRVSLLEHVLSLQTVSPTASGFCLGNFSFRNLHQG